MLNAISSFISKGLDYYFNPNNKPFVSVLLYFVSAILGMMCALSKILPFSLELDFAEKIIWKEDLYCTHTIVQLTFITILIYCIYSLIAKII